jgi:predicted ATPase/DNA-binding CsgD family transcriptional regulator
VASGDRGGNLPAETTSFVGRRRELAEAKSKLLAARLVSVVGPGGVGKTRLARRVATQSARNFPDGVWLVELAEVRDPRLLPGAVLSALDLRQQGRSDPMQTLIGWVNNKRLLVVLDNCEHLSADAARLSSSLLRAGPEVRVLATSREPLGLVEEHVVPLPPLDLPAPGTEDLAQAGLNEAVQLFVERASAASGRFELTAANVAPVIELCRRLDGIPLALELAAVRTRALTPDQIRDRLGHRFALLAGGSPAALPRHQTLQAAIEWSYDLLDEREQLLLRRIGAFAGRFQIDEVEATCLDSDGPLDVTHLVATLVDKSLVARDASGTLACYRLHESMREFALLRLSDAGEVELMQRRLTAHYVLRCAEFAVQGRRLLPEWLAWIDVEIDNVREVLDRLTREGDPTAVRLAAGLVYFWITRATSEGTRRFDELLASHRGNCPAAAYYVRGFLGVLQNDPRVAMTLTEGIRLARETGDPLLPRLLAMASIADTMAGDETTADAHLREAQQITDGTGDVGARLLIQQARALNALLGGDAPTVVAAADAGVHLSRDVGDQYSLEMLLMNLGFGTLMLDRIEHAEQAFREALEIARDLDDRVAACYLLGGLGCCAARTGDARLAAQLFGAMEELRDEVGATLNAGIVRVLRPATAAATKALGPARFGAETAAGRALGRVAAIRLALRGTSTPTTAAPPPVEKASTPLSRREVDVAQLIAEGCTNKEIGARLFLSERTVESHVRNTLNKLGFNSRAQIAAWVSTTTD